MIVFQNKGLIDLRAVRTIGLHAKPETDRPIGEFGTGLKLAVSVILREGGTVTLYRGKVAHRFQVVETEFRGQSVALVAMDGEELGFTLNYGKNWQAWQAFRELYSNMLDELEGSCRPAPDGPDLKDGYTSIVVEGADFDELYRNRRNVFLEGAPLLKVDSLEVHPGKSAAIYYNGMRAMDLPRTSLFTYNLTQPMTLTEDRTFLYPYLAEHHVVRALVACNDEEVIASVLAADQDSWESGFDYNLSAFEDVSGEFMHVAADMKARDKLRSSSAFKLFSKRASTASTYSESRLREPTLVERGLFQRAMVRIWLKIPNIGADECLVQRSPDVDKFYAGANGVEVPANFADMSELDLAVKLATLLCTRSGGSEASADAVARAFLLGSLKTPEGANQ